MQRHLIAGLVSLFAQQPSPSPPPVASEPPAKEWTAAEDQQHMMDQLGIKGLRPGPSGSERAPNAANYDESLANPFPTLPLLLTLNDGRTVTTPALWDERRREIVEEFEREVYGRIPAGVPKVTWTVSQTAKSEIGHHPVIGKRLRGRVDNSSHPSITVTIDLIVVTPADVKKPVPLMIMFRPGTRPGTPVPARASAAPPATGGEPQALEQLIASGWGYALLDPSSVQADNGAGLRKGIIGLANKGQPRKPADWGSLRAWSWGAARALDYLETDRAVDARRVGIAGVSRYGDAALVTMAFEPRFAMALVASSGAGGAKLFRRNFGETVENLTGRGQYHRMAGNFLKYGAAESRFGRMNAGNLPVDAHQLIALCAPRLTFISYGVPEKGDAKWVDPRGSFMAAVAAGLAFRLLGARDLGTSDDYINEKMPPVNVGLLDGHLAWRQHDGGHSDGPNWKYFIDWASKFIERRPSRRRSGKSVNAVRRTLRSSEEHPAAVGRAIRGIAGSREGSAANRARSGAGRSAPAAAATGRADASTARGRSHRGARESPRGAASPRRGALPDRDFPDHHPIQRSCRSLYDAATGVAS